MASYPPPTDNAPIFDSVFFNAVTESGISLGQASALFLARTDTAISIADTTSFTDNVTIGNSMLDYIPTQGLQIRPTVNSESIFLRVLDGTGATKQRIECNQTHTHLYDITRITESATPGNYTTLQQVGSAMNIYNNVSSGSINLIAEGSGGTAFTVLTATQQNISVSPIIGFTVNGAIFGRNDTTANTFYGVLGYTYHPIGWTITATKVITNLISSVARNVLTDGTPTTVFNNLSNGVWRITACCNNSVSVGASTSILLNYGAPTGATVLNGDVTGLYYEEVQAISRFGRSWPELILRTTGNGSTTIVLNILMNFTVIPHVTVYVTASKIA
jgi:hypothetical protein